MSQEIQAAHSEHSCDNTGRGMRRQTTPFADPMLLTQRVN